MDSGVCTYPPAKRITCQGSTTYVRPEKMNGRDIQVRRCRQIITKVVAMTPGACHHGLKKLQPRLPQRHAKDTCCASHADSMYRITEVVGSLSCEIKFVKHSKLPPPSLTSSKAIGSILVCSCPHELNIVLLGKSHNLTSVGNWNFI